jgi:hypothetical protein
VRIHCVEIAFVCSCALSMEQSLMLDSQLMPARFALRPRQC